LIYKLVLVLHLQVIILIISNLKNMKNLGRKLSKKEQSKLIGGTARITCI